VWRIGPGKNQSQVFNAVSVKGVVTYYGLVRVAQ
jgi:hypothetical protein